jgi:hypothetical protein
VSVTTIGPELLAPRILAPVNPEHPDITKAVITNNITTPGKSRHFLQFLVIFPSFFQTVCLEFAPPQLSELECAFWNLPNRIILE